MILIIDDDIAVRTSLKLLLKQNNYKTLAAKNEEEAFEHLEQNTVQLIILDLNFGRETSGDKGLTFLDEIRKNKYLMPVIIITAWGSISLAVDGVKRGASDFITKPWNNDQLLKSINTLLKLNEENTETVERKELNKLFDFDKIIGNDASIVSILQTISKVAKTDASILILGDSGTGKELIAEAIHNNSKRSKNNFVKVNLGGISQSLFESEMFGHKKGAFTDAKSDRVGRFQLADKGTIFLDEIGELSLSEQVKMLRVLQESTFEPLGSSKSYRVDVRVISATNKNLADMVEDNKFREDLYYRLNLIIIKIPSLKDRKDDISLLIQHFIDNLKEIYQRPELSITRKAMNWLKDLEWNGNIRELKNIVERTVLVSANDQLDIDDFSNLMNSNLSKKSLKNMSDLELMPLAELEKSMILKALDYHNYNLSRVARSLGISRSALYRRFEKFNIGFEE
jgi:two-component system NtrC family response regulator